VPFPHFLPPHYATARQSKGSQIIIPIVITITITITITTIDFTLKRQPITQLHYSTS
jgi:hypothetical protein